MFDFGLLMVGDSVYLDDEEEREECVLNELGIIYHGAYDDVAERTWNYGQVQNISFKKYS